MGDFIDPLEILWDNLLSCQPEKIRLAFDMLDQGSRQAVVAHLQRMAYEEGWHPEQRKSALSALTEIQKEGQP